MDLKSVTTPHTQSAAPLRRSGRSFRPAWLYALFFLSGAAALGYQMIWTRMFTAGLGHEVPSVISVAAAFLGGMALGAWRLDRAISRSAQPGRWYASLELIIGGWSALAAALIPSVNQFALQLIGTSASPVRHWTVVFALPFLTLLPATFAMGATLPAMDRFLSPFFPNGRCVGAFYAVNTLGAVAGTLGSVHLLAPTCGFRGSGLILAAINLGCGLMAMALSQAKPQSSLVPGKREQRAGRSLPPLRLNLTLFATGLLGIGFELAGIRVLSQILENTIFTFAMVLAVYLAGTALGAAMGQKFGGRFEFRALLGLLLSALSGACLLGVWFMGRAPDIYDRLLDLVGGSSLGVALAEMTVALLVFGAPTFAMGATFSHLAQGARREDGGVGWAAALNLAGCAAAGVLFIIGLLPRLGAKWTLTVLALGYLLLVPRLRGRVWLALAFPGMMLLALPHDLRLRRLPSEATVLDYRDGVLASVAVIKTPDGHRSLRVNNRLQMGGTAAAIAERRQAHIPFLLHPNPQRALFLGPGTGITLGAVSGHTHLNADGVELVPEVVAVMPAFEPENHGPFPNASVNLTVADARRFVRTTTNRYDVIVGDLFHPAQDGAGFLYTREHFAAIRARLETNGLFCQWLPLHQLDEPTLRVIVRSFLDVFPNTHAFLLHFNVDIPVLGLIGTLHPLALSLEALEQRMHDEALFQALKGVALERTINLAGCLVAGPDSLRKFSEGAALNTDDRPAVTFLAPRANERRWPPPGEVLLKFLAATQPDARAIIPTTGANAATFIANLNDI